MKKLLPDWIRVKPFEKTAYEQILTLLKQNSLNTVCIEADCPNRYECFSRKALTFMILGNVCTRSCGYCNVKSGRPERPDDTEPKRIAALVKRLALKYVVVTSVSRDDLADGGASQFVKTISAVRRRVPSSRIEVLIPDLAGNWDALKQIVDARPTVLGHNIEVVRELFPTLRPEGGYELSLDLLRRAKDLDASITTKSGLMIGLGEDKQQILKAMRYIRNTGCDILTIGQYLQPSKRHEPVRKYYTPEEFRFFKKQGAALGFRHTESGPLVRSSYMGERAISH